MNRWIDGSIDRDRQKQIDTDRQIDRDRQIEID